MSSKQEIGYEYHNAPIPGGGYATGFVFQPAEKGLIYLRTDIGGSYRFDMETQKWVSLSDHLTMEDRAETYPIALAVDERHPERLFIASGVWNEPQGRMSVSHDYGTSFQCFSMPMPIHGNLPGRGTGLRLIVDRKDENTLWFASQTSGLWKSRNLGKDWEKVTTMPEEYLTFVGESLDGELLFVGAAGATCKFSEERSGIALYVSCDGGNRFMPLWQPEYAGPEGLPGEPVILRGPVAQRYTIDEKYLYVTYASRCETRWRPELGYSCDAGKVTDGHVVRFDLQKLQREFSNCQPGADMTCDCTVNRGMSAEGVKQQDIFAMDAAEDITPDWEKRCVPDYPGAVKPCLHLGFSGISTCPHMPGLLICSTIRKSGGDSIYRSLDYGNTWEEILHNLDIGKITFRTEYMKPEYNSGHSMVHWMTDLKIDPNDAQQAWFNTGSGVFRTRNLLGSEVEFTDWSDGVEETVHINVYAPPEGEVLLLDILGDLGGFAFRELDKPCDNSFADAQGNRYITCLNADYSDENPDLVAVTPRGNWTGHTKGGLILSKDNCYTFQRLPMPFGLSDTLDEALHRIEQPNVNSGWVAMSPDGQNLVWSVAKGIHLPLDMVVTSQDQGQHFELVNIYDNAGRKKTEGGFKAFSDRMNSSLFYGFGNHSDIYLSEDGGRNFYQVEVQGLDQGIDFSIVDCADKTEVRAESGKSGVIWFAAGEKGLWKLLFSEKENSSGAGHSEAAGRRACFCTAQRISNPGDRFYHLGLGILRPDGDYFAEEKALYVSANIGGRYGFYRSLDQGQTFQKLNTEKQCFGDINSIDGDKRVFGRFFIGTGSRGVLYGEEKQ